MLPWNSNLNCAGGRRHDQPDGGEEVKGAGKGASKTGDEKSHYSHEENGFAADLVGRQAGHRHCNYCRSQEGKGR